MQRAHPKLASWPPSRRVAAGLALAWLALAYLAILMPTGCRDLSLDLLFADATAPAPSDEGGPSAPPIVHCSTQSQCADAGAPLCNVDAGVCVACVSNNNCSGSTPHCVGGACVSCTADAGCSTGMVCNTHIPRCATQCTSGTQCNGRVCSTQYGYCVECLYNYDCSSPLQFCYGAPAIGLCVECLSNADCHGGYTCGPTRHCAPP